MIARIVSHGKQKKLLADHQTVPNKMSLFCKEMGGLSLCTVEDLISNRVWVFQVTSKHLVESLQCIFSVCFDYIFIYCRWHSHIESHQMLQIQRPKILFYFMYRFPSIAASHMY